MKERYVVGFTGNSCVYGEKSTSSGVTWTDPLSFKAAKKRLDWLDRASGDVAIYKLVKVLKKKRDKHYIQPSS